MNKYWLENKEEYNRKARENYQKKKPEYAARAWKNHLKVQYGITPEEYDSLWNEQGGTCPVCLKFLEYRNRNTHLDHCHKSNTIRGFLHKECNNGIGFLQDDPRVLRRAADYLEGKV